MELLVLQVIRYSRCGYVARSTQPVHLARIFCFFNHLLSLSQILVAVIEKKEEDAE
jgi:hypothetical protein